MPLPKALAARLAQRGLLTASILKNFDVPQPDDEEVFAENYDERIIGRDNDTISAEDGSLTYECSLVQIKIKGYPGCPNKYNIYHECIPYCLKRYGRGKPNPDPKYVKQKEAMLIKYPLPDGWQDVYDPGTGRHYYWDLKTDLVSWLPPRHPRFTPSDPACALREEVKLADSEDDSDSEDDKMEQDKTEDKDDDDDDDDEDEPISLNERRQKFIERIHAKGRVKKKKNDLDPMDPSSYSDVPRGTWNSGLIMDIKTGVDSTASGSLFQQRPLPSPGAILRGKQKPKK